MAEPTGFEPAIFGLTGRYANRCTTAPRIKVSIIILTAVVTFFNTCQEKCSAIYLTMENPGLLWPLHRHITSFPISISLAQVRYLIKNSLTIIDY